MFNYFAYGSVVSLRHAREWCESHGLDVTPFLNAKVARLDGYRIVFDVPSRFWSGLVADLDESAGTSVHGVLFELDDSVREAVMRKEGVATGLYRERKAEVFEAVGGKPVTASIFLAVPERRVAPGPASSRYLDALIEGARERGLPVEWASTLASLPRDNGKPPPPGVGLGVKR
jgi:cation transport regulator ChaC